MVTKSVTTVSTGKPILFYHFFKIQIRVKIKWRVLKFFFLMRNDAATLQFRKDCKTNSKVCTVKKAKLIFFNISKRFIY